MVNRTQALVLGFFVLAVTSLLVILAAAPEVYDQALRLPTGNRPVEIAFLAALLGFITLLGIGVLRRWRWAFWLILVAFLAGVLRGAGGHFAADGGPDGRWSTLVCHLPGAVGRPPAGHRPGHGGRPSSCWCLGEF
jgi:hypothetical protein